jgi:hypothetical protein
MGSSLVLQGGASTQNTLKETFVQSGHGLAVGNAIRYNAVTSRWEKALADTAANAEVAGVVSEILDNDTFTVVYQGWIDLPAFSGISHPALFLSSTTAGGLTFSPPSTIGSVVKPVAVRSSSGQGHLVVNYLGTQIGGSSTVSIDQIQPVGTIMPYAGTTIPDTWLECDGVSYAISDYTDLYNRLLYDTAPRAPMYGHVVEIQFSGGSSTWHGVVQVNDIVLINNSAAAPTTTAFDMIGRVLTKTAPSMAGSVGLTVQILPKYDNSTKTLTVPNRVVANANAVVAYDTITFSNARAGSGTVNTVNVTRFNVPDLRSRFVLGRNANAIGEIENNTTDFSSSLSAYSQGAFGGQESVPAPVVGVASGSINVVAQFTNNLMSNMPPFLATRYIVKAKPYTRAAVIDAVEIDYTKLLVTDLRSGLVRGAGVGEALVFKTNDSISTTGVERMRLTNTSSAAAPGGLILGDTSHTSGGGGPFTTAYRLLEVANTSGGGGGVFVARSASTILEAGANEGLGSCIIGTRTNHPLVLRTNVVERMRIDTNGRVGIGTASPTAILQVGGADGTLPGLFVDQTGTDAATVSKDLAELSVRSPAQVKCAGTSTLELFVGGLSGPVNNLPVGIQASNAAGTTPYNLSLSPFGGYVGVGLGLSAATSMLDVRTGVGKRQWARFLVADSGGKTAAARIRGDSSYTGFLAQFDTDSVTANSGYGLSIQVGNLTQTTATSLAIDAATSSTNATLVSTFSVYGDGRVYARGPVQSGTNITTSSPSTYLTTKQYVDSREYTFTYGITQVLARYSRVGLQGNPTSEDGHFSANYFDVFPPAGKNMSNLIAFIPSPARIYYAGGVDGNDQMWCYYKVKTDRIRVWVFNTENNGNAIGNWFGVWR